MDSLTYAGYFPHNHNPFISGKFIELNSFKVEHVIWLVEKNTDPVIGLVAGIKEGMIRSPFSAPFGGFHFKKENIYIHEIDRFLDLLKEYIVANDLCGIELKTPPDIYHQSFNAKLLNSVVRNGLQFATPDITNWVDLQKFDGRFSQKNSREYFRQAERNRLSFSVAEDEHDRIEVFHLICENRARFDRPIHMTFEDILKTGSLWPVDFFKVESDSGDMLASAIFYRSHPEIAYAVFWGDNEEGRPLRAMDFLLYHLYTHYRNLEFKYIDLGISTEDGIPNEGLLRFKESHEAISSLRYSMTLKF